MVSAKRSSAPDHTREIAGEASDLRTSSLLQPCRRLRQRRSNSMSKGRALPSLRRQAGATYRARLTTPMGIAFEEVAPGKPEGVVIAALVEGGNAAGNAQVQVTLRHEPSTLRPHATLACAACYLCRVDSLLTLGSIPTIAGWRQAAQSLRRDLRGHQAAN